VELVEQGGVGGRGGDLGEAVELGLEVLAFGAQLTDAREDWLTMVQLPGYAPDLNAIERLGNHAAATLDQLEVLVRRRLRGIQRRPDLINALLSKTRLSLDPPP
jgi:hypothetical protein